MSEIEHRVISALRGVLPQAVTVRVMARRGAAVEVKIADTSLRAQWVARGLPAEVRAALASVPMPELIVAPSMSPGARAACEQAGAGWVAEAGGAQFAKGPIVVSRTPSAPESAPPQRGWTAATLGVCEALLTGCAATVAAVVGATGLSAKTATYALRFLTDEGLLERDALRGRNAARRISDHRALLDSYARAAQAFREPSMTVGILWRDELAEAAAAGKLWESAGRAWAATGALAAAALAPYATMIAPLEMFVEARTIADLRVAAQEAGFTVIDAGRLVLRAFPSPATARLSSTSESNLVCAPWPRVYADVRMTGVRGEDVAEHLHELMMRRAKGPT